MEVNFLLLVLAALGGMLTKVIFGWDPWKAFGFLTAVVLFLPIVGLGLISDPVPLRQMIDA